MFFVQHFGSFGLSQYDHVIKTGMAVCVSIFVVGVDSFDVSVDIIPVSLDTLDVNVVTTEMKNFY